MSSRLRTFGLRIAFLFAIIAAAATIRVASAKPTLPAALLDSFDRACQLVEQHIAELEQRASRPRSSLDVVAVLDRLEADIMVAGDAASEALDLELALATDLPWERRMAARGCIERLLGEARCDRLAATDPELRAEYDTTIERLREIRRHV
jgi:hypothetical protein